MLEKSVLSESTFFPYGSYDTAMRLILQRTTKITNSAIGATLCQMPRHPGRFPIQSSLFSFVV